MHIPNSKNQSAKNILKPIKESPFSIHWKLPSKLILQLVSFSVYLWVIERTRSQTPMNNALSQLVKRPKIYLLLMFEASIFGNNLLERLAGSFSQFIKCYYCENASPYYIRSCYYFQTFLESPATPIIFPRDVILPNAGCFMEIKQEEWSYTYKRQKGILDFNPIKWSPISSVRQDT